MCLKYFNLLLITSLTCVVGNILNKDLSGKAWHAAGRNGKSTIVVPINTATVPGCVHTDWIQGKTEKKDDPYYGFNDLNLRWLAEYDWKYSRSFSVDNLLMQQAEQWLVFEGVDTFATVSLNGKVIGMTYNMFVTYRFNITGILQPSFNILDVSFTSAITQAATYASTNTYIIPPQCPPDVQQGLCHVNFIRKEQSSFSWDWGPGFATQGIWKPVYLSAFSHVHLVHATASFDWEKIVLGINLQVQHTTSSSKACTGNVVVSIEELKFSKQFANVSIPFSSKNQFTMLDFNVDFSNVSFERWWPNGYGSPKLYNVTVRLNSSGEASSKSFMFGFRKVELVQEKIEGSKGGLSFYFKVNDVAIFAKGANWIPADAFNNRVTSERVENLLESARVAHMNMLRVWGGGVYESSTFYELADRKGIMLWQDMMFACAMYPAAMPFLDNVTQEVEDVMWRLKHHASIVVWAGNNENEAALATDWYNTTSHFDRYKSDYVKLYVDTIGTIVKKRDPSRPFLTSSPTNGADTVAEGWVARDPYSDQYGDVHYYNYDDDCLDWTKYPRTRFASEYGFQSWPSLATLRPVSDPADWRLDSKWAAHRQHHANGSRQISQQIARHFTLPNKENATLEFVQMIYMSQIMQALCYKSETEFYLRNRDHLNAAGEGNTMGALYWQLNDIWQAPTWSSIEYGGKWKALHYFARNFFAPVTLIAYDDDTQLTVYASSSRDTAVNDVIRVAVHQWDALGDGAAYISRDVTVPPRTAALLVQESVGTILHYGGCPYKERCFLSVSLKNDRSVPTTYFFPVPFKNIEGLNNPRLQVVRVEQTDSNEFEVELNATSPAAFVWMEADQIEGRFSDNAFLMTSQARNVTFYSWAKNTTTKQLRQSLTLTSLYDVVEHGPHGLAWLDDVTAKLIFAVVGVVFILMAAVQVAFLIIRFNHPSANRRPSRVMTSSLPNSSVRSASISSSKFSTRNEIGDEASAFLIRPKRNHAKQTEIRFYVV